MNLENIGKFLYDIVARIATYNDKSRSDGTVQYRLMRWM